MVQVPVNFVIECSDEELDGYQNIDVHDNPNLFTNGNFCWCLQTFLFLNKRNKISVQCSNKLLPNAINLVHSDQLLRLKGSPNDFVVCVRADYPKRIWAHYHIVQNKKQVSSSTSFIPHWIQPGLIKRNLSRDRVMTVAYSGQTFNGNLAGTQESWKKLFMPHGIEFVTLTAGSWHDLRNIDVLVALRSFTKETHDTKPPSKLFTAWHAQIPFIGGYDSAYRQVGTSNKDYLIAKTPEEVVNLVLELKKNPERYNQLVNNGSKMAMLFNNETIAEIWENILVSSIWKRYQTWQSRRLFEKIRFTVFLKTGIIEHNIKQLIKRLIARS